MIETYTNNQKHYAKCIARNFYQDCKAFDKYHMPYEQFMDRLIMSLIERQDKLSAYMVSSEFVASSLEPETPLIANTLTSTEDDTLTDVTTAIPDFFILTQSVTIL